MSHGCAKVQWSRKNTDCLYKRQQLMFWTKVICLRRVTPVCWCVFIGSSRQSSMMSVFTPFTQNSDDQFSYASHSTILWSVFWRSLYQNPMICVDRLFTPKSDDQCFYAPHFKVRWSVFIGYWGQIPMISFTLLTPKSDDLYLKDSDAKVQWSVLHVIPSSRRWSVFF